jgi:DNA-binding CsgD family transcriptional regulator
MNHKPIHTRTGSAAKTPGFILVDSSCRPVFMNSEAADILKFSDKGKASRSGEKGFVDEIRSLFAELTKDSTAPCSAKIQSGKRKYQCSVFSLNAPSSNGNGPVAAILLERNSKPLDFELTAGFSFTPRERQVVQLLALGLTTKEIAGRLQISPNTVKTFLRLVMAKTEVTTRSGIVGKILQNLQD